ncbi:MAG: hypothetical protein C4532_14965 [Candidatus Abyssobacteria bacterium SURF_17]|uniref:Uncharacterized protein n=1 Tax=Candidatus Abyssobacteria bacterium SURF_17 TaxID=2093361 RepID=A0A419ETK2_9BACT|nr:MAG: hypothetical protein C4532_14965 [Candidatus Abyssubacteria bacterium SURF_17]
MEQNLPDEPDMEGQGSDALEKELLDAMRNLTRKNRKIEEYLDGLARSSAKPASGPGEPPPSEPPKA